jgi:hypothetical protein
MALRRFRPRRRAGSVDVHADRYCQAHNVDPQAWLADALHRIADHPARRFKELLPWNWHAPAITHTIAA